jgi:hypothetical protein
MDIITATQKFDTWLGERIPIIKADLDHKHALMREAPFPFMRATFYRWAQTWPLVCPKAAAAPEVLAVGDLHVENFGTWRDIEGRLVWGINDFDEVYPMPYTCDLVRLATSAYLGIAAEHLKIEPAEAAKEILLGYRDGLKAGGRAIVLAEHHPALRQIAVERLKQPELFWEKLKALPTLPGKVPSSAIKGLRRMMPDRELEYRVVHRVSGLGSLGRRRFVALISWHGGTIAREAKELTDSAWRWASGRNVKTRAAKAKIYYQAALDQSRRCPDPFVRLKGQWIVRRLAPDCSRIELASLPTKHDANRLLYSMGWETANVHVGSGKAPLLLKDLTKRGPRWLNVAAEAMVDSIENDWNDWRKHGEKPAVS